MKIGKVVNTKINSTKIQNLIIFLLGFILFFCYLINVPNISTVWEMGDEAGYIGNAAYFAGYKWDELLPNLPGYFGYGYSLLLVPLFFICKTGGTLIRGAIVINVLCIVTMYFIQVYLLPRILKDCSKIVLAFLAFAFCLHPYIASNGMKVLCESFLTLQVWIIGLVFYKALYTKKSGYYIGLGMTTAYIFFIHTRGIAVITAMLLVLIVYFAKDRSQIKQGSFFAVGFSIMFILCYYVKSQIIGLIGTGKFVGTEDTVYNVIGSSYIWDRLKWLFMKENFIYYVTQAFGKTFYLFYSSCGLILFGVTEGARRIWKFLKNDMTENEISDYLVSFFCLSFIVMFLLCCINGVTLERCATVIYGRYFEYTVGFPIILGGYCVITNKFSKKFFPEAGCIIIVVGAVASNVIKIVESDLLGIDTARYAGFSYPVSVNEDYVSMIYYCILVTLLFVVIYWVIQDCKIRKHIIPVCLIIVMVLNSAKCISTINEINDSCKSDMQMAQFMEENGENTLVYFVYEPFRFDLHYMRMQIFLKNSSMHVIYPEEYDSIADDVYIVTYLNSEFASALKTEYQLQPVMTSTYFELFIKD